jgi:tetratricopeptide (TPR) repeat protein
MPSIPPLAQEAIEHARRRDYDKALASATKALAGHQDDMGLQLFVGLLHTRKMDFDKAVPHLRAAVELAPNDVAARIELSRALIAVESLEEAEAILSRPGLPARESEMLRATISSRKGDLPAAIAGFERIVEQDPSDFETWANLGVALLNSGNAAAAADALGRSLQLRPDRPKVRDKWAEARVTSGTGEQALTDLRVAMNQHPDDPLLKVSAARLEDLLGRPDKAVEELEAAAQLDPENPVVLAALADLHERQNRLESFAEVVSRLEKADPQAETLPFLRATLALRQGKPEVALELAQSASAATNPGARAHLIGKVYDRWGRSEEAWQAYSLMNLEDGRVVASASAEADTYRRDLEKQLKVMTPEWATDWSVVDEPASTPAFIVGFPRSGTTLLDTFLMADRNVCVSEENRMLQTVSDAAKDLKRLPSMTAPGVNALRDLYFNEASRYVPGWQGSLLVDKLPFALVAGPHIHRLFPGARIIFVERHPCDVVLSCYFNRFIPTGAGASFVDLVDTAKLYDSMMRFWYRSRELLPLWVHPVRYENMIMDTEAELRAVAEFLTLDWTEDLMNNRETAIKRGFIKTPSYAQVTQPIYKDSVARWTRYRTQFEPVLPILEPWVTRLGYEL